MTIAFIGIGSNIGDKELNCLRAVEDLKQIPSCRVIGRSAWYQTKPVGVEGQEWYVNGVASLSTDGMISAWDLLSHLRAIESKMGRVRKKRWESRIIDLDILLFGKEIIYREDLKIPHPLMHLRGFVLVPMADLAPDYTHPSIGASMIELLQALPEEGPAVIPLKDE